MFKFHYVKKTFNYVKILLEEVSVQLYQILNTKSKLQYPFHLYLLYNSRG